jgi:FAD/FMN-containing dehydrogenase
VRDDTVLEALLSDGGRVIEGTDDFTVDHRKTYSAAGAPVVQPASVAEICALVRHAVGNGLSITPQGGTTSMGGGAIPLTGTGLILSTKRLNTIRSLSVTGRHVVADAGVTIDEINAQAAQHGLCVAIAFGASGTASVGGVLSTNAGGMNVLRYGIARAHVLEMDPALTQVSPWYALVRFGSTRDVSAVSHAFFERAFAAGIGTDGVQPVSSQQEDALWRLRDAIPRLHQQFAAYQAFDIAVAIDRLDALYRQLEEAIHRAHPQCDIVCFGHVGDGSLLFSVCHRDTPPDDAVRHRIAQTVNDIVWAQQGTISAEHGIGRAHVAELHQQKSAIETQLAHRLKTAFDPDGLFNPRVIFARP